MNDGVIQSNSAAGNGGGVLLYTGNFNMNGGRIGGTTTDTRNTALNGGGVCLDNPGNIMTMSGDASISGNNATNGGGGIYIGNGTFNMNGTAVISNNTVTAGVNKNGGGVLLVGSNVQMIMSGNADISNNTIATGTNSFGGGVYIATGARLTMNENATIRYNNAPSGGGVLFTDSTSVFTFNNGHIYGNSATTNGGGVFMQNGTVHMTGGRIGALADVQNDRNRAASGGGVYINTNGTFNMSGTAVISGNNATTSGGGVFITSGTFNLSGGTIGGIGTGVQFQNTALAGGGVNVSTLGTFRMGGDARVIIRTSDNDIDLLASRTVQITADFSGSDQVGRIRPASYLTTTQVLSGTGFLSDNYTRFDVNPNGTVQWMITPTGFLQLPPLTGTITITGTPEVGQTLGVDTTQLGGSGTISYQWLRGGTAITGATASTYLLTNEDSGQSITVSVTRANNSGNVTSDPVIIKVTSGITINIPVFTDINPPALVEPGYIDVNTSRIFNAPLRDGGGLYSSYKWYVNGTLISEITSVNTFEYTFNAPGVHEIAVVTTYEGETRSGGIRVTVLR